MRRRIRWDRVLMAAALVIGVAAGAYQYITAPTTRLIEYRREVKPGDTLWNICAGIATDKEDMGRLVWQARRDNRITDPGNLQPGAIVVVRVKEAK